MFHEYFAIFKNNQILLHKISCLIVVTIKLFLGETFPFKDKDGFVEHLSRT